MATGNKVETNVSKSLKKKFKAKCKRRKTTMAKVLRDHMRAFVK